VAQRVRVIGLWASGPQNLQDEVGVTTTMTGMPPTRPTTASHHATSAEGAGRACHMLMRLSVGLRASARIGRGNVAGVKPRPTCSGCVVEGG